MITKRQLVTRVLLRLGEISAEETPTADAMTYVSDEYDTKRLEWRDAGLCWWPNTDLNTAEIPDQAVGPLINLMVNVVGPAFGRDMSLADQMAQEEILLRPLRRIHAKPASGEPTSFDVY